MSGSDLMKLVLWTRYGPPNVLKVITGPRPRPKKNEVLVRVHASTVTAGDCELRRFEVASWIRLPLRLVVGLVKPRIPVLGQEWSGEVVECGDNVTRFEPGDRIFASPGLKFGGYAEYTTIKSSYPAIASLKDGLKHYQAATIPTGGINGLHFIRKSLIQAGEHLLINGAGGSIGTYALQLAKLKGAEVTCVDHSSKLDFLLSLGADHVLDYLTQDFTDAIDTYDAVIDVVGKYQYTKTIRSLKAGGRFVMGNPGFFDSVRSLWTSLTSQKKVIPAIAGYRLEDFDYLQSLIESGKLKVAVDKVFPLDEVAAAHSYVESGHKKGNVIINNQGNPDLYP